MVTDTFAGLIQDVPEGYCTGHLKPENFAYPIAGKVGIDELVREFLENTLFSNLSGNDVKNSITVSGPPTMARADAVSNNHYRH